LASRGSTLLFIGLFMKQFTGNFAFAHHHDAVGDASTSGRSLEANNTATPRAASA
jgi:hypothetical protein